VITHLGPESLRALLHRRQVAANRDVFCARYERCLDEALEKRWVSWTCAHCVQFEASRHAMLAAQTALA
jgi:hypothetical protein